MPVDVNIIGLLQKAQQTNKQFKDFIKKIEDSIIKTELEDFFTIIKKSLKKIEGLIEEEIQLKNTLQYEMCRIRGLIEAKIGLFEPKINDFFEKNAVIERLFRGLNFDFF